MLTVLPLVARIAVVWTKATEDIVSRTLPQGRTLLQTAAQNKNEGKNKRSSSICLLLHPAPVRCKNYAPWGDILYLLSDIKTYRASILFQHLNKESYSNNNIRNNEQ